MKKIMITLGFAALALGAQAQSVNGYGADDSSFITQWTVTAATTVTIPITGNGFNISWWQGTGVATAGVNTVVANGSTTSITFPAAGTYTVAIPPGTGAATRFSAIAMNYNSSMSYLTQVMQWGTTAWSSFNAAFAGCSKLTISATDIPNLTSATDLTRMFAGCSSITTVPNINEWQTGNVTSLYQTFWGVTAFNQDISNWDVSNVTNMFGTFESAAAFNQPLNSWQTGKVTNMAYMFSGATAFNEPLNNWQTGNVTDMSYMFVSASAFNGDISSWNVSNVTNMSYMFYNASVFNVPLDSWQTGKVTNMTNTFYGAKSFNQPLNNWNVSSVTGMFGMFGNATVFNQPLDNWNTSNVQNMSGMFANTSAFNQDIGDWDVSSVIYMNGTFSGATVFNQNIGGWNISNAIDIGAMFLNATAFNQPLDKWNTSSVTNMNSTFANAKSFNQNLGSWNLSSINTNSSQSLVTMLDNSGLSCANYDSTLQGWAANTATPNGLTLGASGLTYDKTAAQAAHDSLTNLKNWTITGDAGGSCVLPITLSSFSAVKQGNTALLQWTTATEITNKGFSVERSTDAQTWSDIGFVNSEAANGNSSSSLNYSYTDNNPASGINYYRLKQTDLNGNAAFSPVRSVDFGIKASVYPVPASTQLYVSVAANSSYQLIDVLGRTVLSGNLNAGKNIINVSRVENGVYFLRIFADTSSSVFKVIVKK